MSDGYLAFLAIIVMVAVWVLILCSKKTAVHRSPQRKSSRYSTSSDGSGYTYIPDSGGTHHAASDCSNHSDGGGCSDGGGGGGD